MELTTIIEAHKFDDLRVELRRLVNGVENGIDGAVDALVEGVTKAESRYNLLSDDFNRWCAGSKVSQAGRARLKRTVREFHELLTEASRTLKTVGHHVNLPALPRSPLPPSFNTIWRPGDPAGNNDPDSPWSLDATSNHP